MCRVDVVVVVVVVDAVVEVVWWAVVSSPYVRLLRLFATGVENQQLGSCLDFLSDFLSDSLAPSSLLFSSRSQNRTAAAAGKTIQRAEVWRGGRVGAGLETDRKRHRQQGRAGQGRAMHRNKEQPPSESQQATIILHRGYERDRQTDRRNRETDGIETE